MATSAVAVQVSRRSGVPPRGTARRVLVIDDDPCMRELLRLHLSNAGYEVVAAEDAVVALKLMLRQPPDLMIVDVEMPYMGGLELIGTLKQDALYASIPALVLTARQDADDAARRAGALACLKKPLFADQLLTAVAEALPGTRMAIA